MKKIIIINIVLLFIGIDLFSQSKLFIPNEFINAYKANTRSKTGDPGDNYFINYSDYTIKATFDSETGLLKGSEKIVYHNFSPDSLQIIIIRLYKNLFKKGNARDFMINPADVTDGIIISDFKINNKELDISNFQFYGTNMFVNLPDALAPNAELVIEINWEYSTPLQTTIRNGRYGENIFMVAYWYPQIAVYDDIFGWDNNSFSGTQEYYNDHSNFDVTITVDAPNLVWATGVLQNPNDVFQKKYAERLKAAKKTSDVVVIVAPDDYAKGNILKNKKENSWHYLAEKVPDFAFAVSDKHNWDATSISMPDRAERVLVNAVYADSSEIYHSLAEVSRKIIGYFSFKKPGIYYPYPAMTVFEGGGGMEYPMMVNEGDIEDECAFYYVTAHEIGHTYFPFYTGTNESRYAWMDEGLISYFPRFAVDDLFGTCNKKQDIISNYSRIAGTSNDMPLMVPSILYKNFFAYRNIAYNRPAYALYILNEYLGDSLFYASIQEYVERWKYKHPCPYDFFYTFEDVVKEDLAWIWKPFFFEFVTPNLSITDAEFNGGLYFSVQNTGGIPLPVNLKIIFSGNRTQDVVKDVSCWKDTDKIDFYIPMTEKPVKIIMQNELIPDIDMSDNIFEF